MSSELEFVEDRCRRLLLLQSVVDQGGIRSTTKCTSKNQVLATRLLHMLSSHRRHTRKKKPNKKKEEKKQKNSLRRREEEETFRKRKRASAVSTTAATTAATERSRIIRRRINTKTKQKSKKREKKTHAHKMQSPVQHRTVRVSFRFFFQRTEGYLFGPRWVGIRTKFTAGPVFRSVLWRRLSMAL